MSWEIFNFSVVFDHFIDIQFVFSARDEKEQTQFSLNALQKERIAKEKAMERDRERIEKLQQNARVNKELMEKMKENIHSKSGPRC